MAVAFRLVSCPLQCRESFPARQSPRANHRRTARYQEENDDIADGIGVDGVHVKSFLVALS